MIEQRILYFSEVVQFFQRNIRSCLLTFAAVFFLTFGLCFFLKESLYEASATFKKAQSPGEEAGSFQAFLKSIQHLSDESAASGIMQSKILLKEAAKRVGLQASVQGFSNLEFQLEKPAVFTLVPIDETHYEIEGHGEAEVGKRVQMEGASWILKEMPARSLRVELMPMRMLLENIRKHLKIRSSRIDAHLLHLTFKHRDRNLAIAFLDALMDSYKDHLEKQHEKIALAQIAYLQKRRDQLSGEFEGALDEHVAYLESESKDQGYLGLSQEVEMLSEPKETYLSKKHQLDLELKKWRAPQLETAAQHPWKEGVDMREQLAFKQARIIGDVAPAGEFSGIDLELAESLFDACATQRDQLAQELANIDRVLEKIDREDFAISNLGKMLEDPVSQTIIAKATELALQIADAGNYTSRELKVARKAREIQRGYLKEHLLKQRRTLEDRIEIACEKLAKLRGAALDLIEREKQNVELKLQEIGDEMYKIPAKWRKESQLKMKKELTMQIMEGLSQLSESKVINHHLFHIESGPLDPADSPLQPCPRHLLLLSSIGGITGAFFFFLVRLLAAISSGLPISRPYLLERGYHLIEGPSKLEKLILYIEPDEVVALIGSVPADDLQAALKRKGIQAKIEEMPKTPFEWERPIGCVLLICRDEQEAVRSAFIADRFVIQMLGKKPEDLDVFPKQKLHCML